MRLMIAMTVAGAVLAGCERCQLDPRADVNVGIGSGGVSTGVSVGQSCGPINFSIGAGDYYHVNW